MNNLLRRSKGFLKRNGSTILTCAGGLGVIATTVTAIRAGSKATLRLNEAKEEKGEELTAAETFKIAAPIYAPTILLGASTIVCIFGANILNKRQQAGLASAYALVSNSFQEYKAKVKEMYGEEAEKNIQVELMKDKYEGFYSEETQLFYDMFSERYFESTISKVMKAEYEMNRMMSQEFGVFLNEFYDLLGIDTIPHGDYLGWSSYALCDMYWDSWIEFRHEKAVMDDGMECTIIIMDREPIYDFENY